MKVTIKCPNCGFENKINVDDFKEYYIPSSIYCDVEEGGCDKLFGFQINFIPQIRVWYMEELED